MYLFPWQKTVSALRHALQRAPATAERAVTWRENAVVEQELALQAVEYLCDHLVYYEQFSAAAHLLAWCIPADVRAHPRVQALLEMALVHAELMATPEIEAIGSKAHVHAIEDTFMRDPRSKLPGRAWFWLNSVRLRGAKRVLEYGTGCGSNVMHLARMERSVEWCGTDVSDQQVFRNAEQATRLGIANAHFVVDLLPLPVCNGTILWTAKTGEVKQPCGSPLGGTHAPGCNLPDPVHAAHCGAPLRYDAVALLDILEHTVHPLELVERAESYVRPGGIMTIVVPKGPWSPHAPDADRTRLVGCHVNVSTVQDLITLAHQRGGRVLSVAEFPGLLPDEANSSACITYEPAPRA